MCERSAQAHSNHFISTTSTKVTLRVCTAYWHNHFWALYFCRLAIDRKTFSPQSFHLHICYYSYLKIGLPTWNVLHQAAIKATTYTRMNDHHVCSTSMLYIDHVLPLPNVLYASLDTMEIRSSSPHPPLPVLSCSSTLPPAERSRSTNIQTQW